MRAIARLAAAALLLAGCGASAAEIAAPVAQVHTQDGLEQQITVTPRADDPAWFDLRSTLVNRGGAPVTVRVATCWLDPLVNLRTRAKFNGYAIPTCIQAPDVVTLAPGQASGTVWFSGRIERAGRYRIEVRHALDPEFWGEVEVVAR